MRNLQPLSNRMEAARGSNLAQVKTQQMAREGEEKVRLKRVKGTIVLIEQFLLDQGYSQALQALQTESQVSLSQYCAADNMDLLSIISEFENYYEFKFQHRPKLFRLTNADHDGVRAVTEGCEKMLVRKRHTTAPTSAPPALTYATADDRMSASPDAGAGCGRLLGQLRPAGALSRALGRIDRSEAAASPVTSPRKEKGKSGGTRALNLDVQKISCAPCVTAVQEEADDGFTGRGLKPLPRFASSELTELAAVIQRDILDVNPSVHWSDIADLESAKHLLKEAVVMPVKYPELFEGILRPWKGILLFGPPGTGKTLLAKAVATECRTTFFNISASSVVSKWRGDSEKLVRLLFDLAVHYAPSTIFIDEIDSLMSARSSEGEHEGSRRMKTELLIQMDGLSKRQGGDVVFVLAASNVPWDLDTAMLRRLEKRILVSLPTEAARGQMFQRLLHKHASQDGTMSWSECAKLTDGMSGADIDVVCREAMMRPIRKMIVKLETCPPSDRHELEKYRLEKPRVSLEDVKASIACTKSSVRGADLAKYDLWATQYGSGMSV